MNLLIITPDINVPTETFIKAHIKYIEAKKYVIHGCYPVFKNGSRYLDSFFPKYNPFLNKIESILPYFIAFRIKLKRSLLNSHEAYFERYLKNRKIEVVLAEYGTTGADISPVCAKLGIPFIVHFHGFDAYSRDILSVKLHAYKEMFAASSRIIAVSRHMVRELITLGAPKDKVIYNPYGPMPEFYNVKPDYTSNQIIAVGRFVEKKAPYLTLEAFRRALFNHPELNLVMVGDGPLLPICQRLVRAWNIHRKVRFTGSIAHNKVIQLMETSFCFLQHSLTAINGDCEGTPVSILEAGAAALPVVATRHCGINDVVIYGETGFLVDEGDVNGMVVLLNKLANERNKAEKYGAAARAYVAQNYSIEKHIFILESILAEVI